jgi:hypothetical protein
LVIGVIGPLEKIQKKIKKEEDKFDHEIETESGNYETEINKVSEWDLTSLKREAEILGQEIHEKAVELDKDLEKSSETKQATKRKRKKRR